MADPDDPAFARTEAPTPAPEFARTVMATLEAPTTSGDAALPTGGARYAIASLIGEGGMGRVLEARDVQFSRTVALKTLHQHGSGTAARERFALEALVTGNLEHPGVPTVYERGVLSDGSPFYAMRLVRGRTFAEAVADAPDIAARLRLVPVVIKVAQTLGYAHERSIVHRDIKPDNIIVGRYGEAVVLDWGVAKVRGVDSIDAASGRADGLAVGTTARTQQGSVIGTPAYMAPEQAAGAVEKIDARTDVFALGALLYHLLTGRAPYDGLTVGSVIEKAVRADFTPLRLAATEAPRGIREICERAMARAPDDRYQTATELADALESFTANAVAGKESSAVRWFTNGLVILGLSGTLGIAVVTISVVSNLREQGWGGPFVVAFGVCGCLFSVIEYLTRARHRLAPLAFAFAFVTALMGLAGSVGDVAQTFRILGTSEVRKDPERFRRTLAVGIFESTGAASTGLVLASVQLLLWGVARRRDRSLESGAALRPGGTSVTS